MSSLYLAENDSPYRYAPLEDVSTLRLLKILPERKNGHVVCLLYHFSPDEVNKSVDTCYLALSYTWGDLSRPKKPIKLGDARNGTLHDHEVYENLGHFLDAAQSVPGMCNFLYWTDYLCLDQNSTSEKDQQVPRMRDIYSNAAYTLAWLGRDQMEQICESEIVREENTFETLITQIRGWIQRVGHSSIEAQIQSATRELPSHWSWVLRDPAASFEIERIEWPGDIDMHLMQRFLQMTYWTRIWIVQEVALSRNVSFVWGNQYLNMQDLILAYKVFMINAVTSHDFPEVFTTRGRGVEGIPAIEAAISLREGHLNFQDILYWTDVCQSTNVVDRVYGLLGLYAGRGANATTWIENLGVDSTKEPNMVLWDVVLEMPWRFYDAEEILTSLRGSLGCSGDNCRVLESLVDSPKFSTRHRDLANNVLAIFWGLNSVFDWVHRDENEKTSPDVETGVAKIALILTCKDAKRVGPAACPTRPIPLDKAYLWRCSTHRLHGGLQSTVLATHSASHRPSSGLTRCSEGTNCQDTLMYLENASPRCWFKCSRRGDSRWGDLVLETTTPNPDNQAS